VKRIVMQGKIVKGIAGFYYVYEERSGELFECKAKGIFRKERIKPLVGDNVLLTEVAGERRSGNIHSV
jgi:ribosome biogenesis GTPase